MIGSALTSHTYDISVVIPTYNRKEILEMTIQALDTQTLNKERFEVIVVNDGSSDDTAEFLERVKNRRSLNFTYISQKNTGQGMARNAGVQVAEGRIILFLGDDHIPTPRLLERHLEVHDMFFTENFAVLGYTTWHPDITVDPVMTFMEQVGMQFKYPALLKKTPLYEDNDLRLANYLYFYTGNISLKRSLLLRYPFDKEFSSYGWEDIALGRKLEEEVDLQVLFTQSAFAYHYHPMNEDSMLKRAYQIGSSAVLATKVEPTMNILPSWWKKVIFTIMASRPFISLCGSLRTKYKGKMVDIFTYLYFYGKMKKEYLRGIKSAQKNHT